MYKSIANFKYEILNLIRGQKTYQTCDKKVEEIYLEAGLLWGVVYCSKLIGNEYIKCVWIMFSTIVKN